MLEVALMDTNNINDQIIVDRCEQIDTLASDITQLNDVFVDLSLMVSNQGQTLDHIEYNINNTQHNVAKGTKQLVKANKYQKYRNDKYCWVITCLLTSIFSVLIILVVKVNI